MTPPSDLDLETMSLRRRKRLLLILAGIILLPVLMVLGLYVAYRVGNTRAIARLEAKVRQRGEPLTLAELAARYPAVGDEENAAVPLLELWQREEPAFWKAFLSGQKPLPGRTGRPVDPHLPVLGSKARTLAGTKSIPAASLQAAEEYLKEYAEHMAAVRLALQRPRFRFPIRLQDGPHTLLPHLALLKGEAQRFRLEALVATEKGASDAAIIAITHTAAVGNLLSAEPLLISQLVRLACLGLALDGAQGMLSRGPPSLAQVNQLSNLFHQMQNTGAVHFVLSSERAMALSAFDPSGRPFDVDVGAGDDGAGLGASGYSTGVKVLTAIGLAGADQRLMLEAFEQAIELAGESSPEALRRYEALQDELRGKARGFPPKIFTGLLLPQFQKVPHRYAAFEGRRRAAVTALAVEQYRLEHQGMLPGELQQLVPRHLPALLLDPFDGQPLRYRRADPGYVIYCIGSDRVDNGGRERPPSGRVEDTDECFTVGR